MHARAVDDAATRLRDLRREEWEGLALGAVALALSLGATQLRPAFAIPLFVGGILVGARGLVATVRRWDLVDRLADEPDAYWIPEVLEYARREATMARRNARAASLRHLDAAVGPAWRPGPLPPELEALADELADDRLELDPACAVACAHLVSDADSPLFDPATAPAVLRSRVAHIRAGFRPAAGPR